MVKDKARLREKIQILLSYSHISIAPFHSDFNCVCIQQSDLTVL